ncbi:MAG: hypothetical protein GY928_35275 [Colwellia sp.]|nr:hypothetical protein [Colwellia sp.]
MSEESLKKYGKSLAMGMSLLFGIAVTTEYSLWQFLLKFRNVEGSNDKAVMMNFIKQKRHKKGMAVYLEQEQLLDEEFKSSKKLIKKRVLSKDGKVLPFGTKIREDIPVMRNVEMVGYLCVKYSFTQESMCPEELKQIIDYAHWNRICNKVIFGDSIIRWLFELSIDRMRSEIFTNDYIIILNDIGHKRYISCETMKLILRIIMNNNEVVWAQKRAMKRKIEYKCRLCLKNIHCDWIEHILAGKCEIFSLNVGESVIEQWAIKRFDMAWVYRIDMRVRILNKLVGMLLKYKFLSLILIMFQSS